METPSQIAAQQQPAPWSAAVIVLRWLRERFPGMNWELDAAWENQSVQPTSSAVPSLWPIQDGLGELRGVLRCVPKSPPDRLTSHDCSIVERAIHWWGDLLRLEAERNAALDRAAAAEALALLDPLTQLPNRRAWESALSREEQRCRRGQHAAAIVCLDLDRLKEYNDRAGHAAGDALLRTTADCLRRALRPHDTAARLGGDEFGILLVECAADAVPGIVARIRNALAAAGVTATIGWSARHEDADLHAVWRAADQTLIAAKSTPSR